MTTEGNIRWPPMCNPYDSKTPPDNFGANLMQINCRKKYNGGQNGRHNGGYNGGNNGGHYKNKKNGNGKHRPNHHKNGNYKGGKDAWIFVPTPKDMKPDKYKGGHLVYKKVVKGKVWWWCAKCSTNGKWTTSHSTYQHDANFKSNHQRKQTVGQANFGEGLVVGNRKSVTSIFNYRRLRLSEILYIYIHMICTRSKTTIAEACRTYRIRYCDA